MLDKTEVQYLKGCRDRYLNISFFDVYVINYMYIWRNSSEIIMSYAEHTFL